MANPATDDPVESPPEASSPPGIAAGDPPPAASGCRPPANIRREVERYEAAATVGVWQGPRYRMTYRILGDGPPLIWVPGIAATYRVYALVLNQLAGRFRTIQYTFPGDDPSDGAGLGRIGHEHLADDLFGLIDHLRLGRVFLAGLSFGSTIVLRALAREPRRFPRSIVQGAFARRKFSAAERLALALGRLVPGTAASLPLREQVLTYNSKPDFPSILLDRWPFYLEQNGLTPIRALAHRTSLVARMDLRPILETIQADLLLIQGREDRIVPMRYFEELKSLLPRPEVAVMATVGHIPHLTHAELLAKLVGDWLLPCAEGGQCTREGGPGPGGGPPS